MDLRCNPEKEKDYTGVVGRRAVPVEIRDHQGETSYSVNRSERIGQSLRYGIGQYVNDRDALWDFILQDIVLTGKVDVIFVAV
jgi:hypothetical protein